MPTCSRLSINDPSCYKSFAVPPGIHATLQSRDVVFMEDSVSPLGESTYLIPASMFLK